MIKKLSILLLALCLFACSKPDSADTSGSYSSNTPPAPVAEHAEHSHEAKTPMPNMLEKFSEGVHYARIKTPIAVTGDNITVTEFFWYGCPHCEAFEPHLVEWEKNKAADVVLQRSPAIWHEAMNLHAKLYFLAETLENSEVVHTALFKEVIAIRAEQDMAVQNRKFAELFATWGVAAAEYEKQMASPLFAEQVDAAMKLMKQAEVSGTPAIVVNGKYRVLNDSVSSLGEVMTIADFLIDKERREK
jgi:protein dithiol oxidoreductase (disulfide-forming)